MRDFIDWYVSLSPWLRFSVSGFLLLLGLIFFLLGLDRFWAWAWGLGMVLLVFSFPSDASRKGYHDF